MKIAIPHQDGRLHGHFGGCREFALVQVDPGQHTVLHTEVLAAPEHTPGAFPRWLRELGVELVIAGVEIESLHPPAMAPPCQRSLTTQVWTPFELRLYVR